MSEANFPNTEADRQFEAVLDRSSLGTPAVQALIESVDPARVQAVRTRAAALESQDNSAGSATDPSPQQAE
jgi:hypothetical protein